MRVILAITAVFAIIYMSSETVTPPKSCNGKIVCVWLIK